MASDIPGRYSANRLFEWVSALGMLLTGITLMYWPHTLPAGNLRPLLHVLTEGELTAVYLTLGAARSVTLFLNGSLGIWGPRVRAIMSSLSFMVLLQMIAALWLQLGQPSMITGFLVALAGGEFKSVIRAKGEGNGSRR